MAPAVYNGYVYLAGGANGSVGQTNTIYYNKIDAATGNIGTVWSVASMTLDHSLRRADAVAMNGYLYVVGGHDGGTLTTYGDIEIGKIDMSTGNIPITAHTSLLTDSVIQVTQRWDARAVFANGYIYVSGGCSSGNPPAGWAAVGGVSTVVEDFRFITLATTVLARGRMALAR